MKRTLKSLISYVAVTFLATFLFLPAFPQQATTLVYHYPSDMPVNYLKTQKITQTMDVNGEEMRVNIDFRLDFSVKSAGMQDKNIKLEFRVDSMYQSVDSPQGKVGGYVPDASGKVFDMVYTPSGKEIDNSGAKAVVVNIEGTGPSNLSQAFNGILPVLPAGQVSPGFSWDYSDTVKFDTETSSLNQIVRSKNTFLGFEDYMGVKCAKISSDLDGIWNMKNQAQGMDMTLKGDFTGTSLFWFAPDKGYFMKETVSMKMKGIIDMPSVGATFPIVMDIINNSEAGK